MTERIELMPVKSPQPAPPSSPPTESAPTTVVPALQRVTLEQLAGLPDNERRTLWINSLVEAEVARQNYAQDRALAREFATCGQFEDIKGLSAEQAISTAMVKIQLGRAWGFNAADSIRYIYFANGRPSVENEMVATRLRDAGYSWDVEWLEETTQHKGKPWQRCVGCKLWVKQWSNERQTFHPMVDRNGQPVFVAFTEADADRAMIWDKGKQIPLSEKWNFKSWAKDMYFWRAVGRVKKYYAPDVLRGAVLREEALEVMPSQGQETQPTAAPTAETGRPTARDVILGQASFLGDTPAEEAAEKSKEAQP